jgi:hypothetical protein
MIHSGLAHSSTWVDIYNEAPRVRIFTETVLSAREGRWSGRCFCSLPSWLWDHTQRGSRYAIRPIENLGKAGHLGLSCLVYTMPMLLREIGRRKFPSAPRLRWA